MGVHLINFDNVDMGRFGSQFLFNTFEFDDVGESI